MNAVFLPRGLRNNNPLNIRHGRSRWRGMSTVQDDVSFVSFQHACYGYRAAFKLLRNYVRMGHNTLERIISRWAPESDGNDTRVYLQRVVNLSGLHADTVLDLSKSDVGVPLVMAMSRVENGVPAVLSDVLLGWKLAQH